MRSIFLLTYGWTDWQGPDITQTHSSIDSAEKSGQAFMAEEERFRAMSVSATSFYRIERFNFDVVIAEVKS